MTKRNEQGDKLPEFKSMAEEKEYIVRVGADRMFHTMKAMREIVGERPYGNLPTDPKARLTKYFEIRNDQEAIKNSLRGQVVVKEDGRMLIRKNVLAATIAAEKKLREGGL